ncbi:asparagine synthase (glutamine-hydrolyzing) [Anaeromyxobacter diazotrophicus]|uniref:asparagine synthase (glutamine-hydrolyzing) n=1 Tax=Anaeromyxobacter diazotrophicus TaxID=2590199 RepID=A0A7I9VNB9_9BACT|nr:asparagine synthase (glutamine-hydrolyzing) [Anaeromyxobacter diazotrophicus]GEJ57610.1 asparagine synthase (glutamine-hydrolyzing) [Anaeromyxobacter diazotrophicus]
MCGIAGVVLLREALPPPRLEDVGAMIQALGHRGPDACGAYRDRRAALGHTRLSIVDLAGGQQPLANEDETLWIVFNGEIFNHLELRGELEALGHRFRTRSDTEVVVHAYEAWGDAAFARFNGQFAAALWDSTAETLVLARDAAGVCPLYLAEHEGRLWFASEVKALFAGAPGLSRALDPVGLAETFTFWTVVPPQAVFQAVTELEPGHVRRISRGLGTDRAFWTPRYPAGPGEGFQGSLDEAAERVGAALGEAVRRRVLQADVPVGSYLSGGLDSSLVAALGCQARGGRFRTYSIRFEEPEYDETRYQRAVVELIGSEHQELLVRREDIAEAFPAVVEHAERPLLRTAPAPLFLLSRLVRDSGVKAVLTGEGADEMFAGYDLFREAKVRRFWGRRPASALRLRLLERLYPYLARSPVAQRALAREFFGRDRERPHAPGFAHQTRWRPTAALQRLFSPDLRELARTAQVTARLLGTLPAEFGSWVPLAQDQYLEIRTLLAGYLLSSQGDRMLMAHAVEGRFPFLDPELVELANALPARYKLRALREKHVLKRAAASHLPPEIVRRTKQPYRAPDALSFVGPRAPAWVGELLGERAVARAGVFDPRAVARLWRKCRAGSAAAQLSHSDNMALVGVLSTALLHEQLVRRRPERRAAPELGTLVDRLGEWPGSEAPLQRRCGP